MRRSLLLLLFSPGIFLCEAQQKAVVSEQDYQRAQRFLSANATQLVDHGNIYPEWISGSLFWYQDFDPKGSTFYIVDAARKTRKPAFDHQQLAAALNKATGKNYLATRLPLYGPELSADGKAMRFSLDGKDWKFSAGALQEQKQTAARGEHPPEVLSPDGSRAAFIRNDNLWLRDTKTNQEKQLTTDGVKDYGYATDNAGWSTSDKAILAWSPDSKKIATFKQDQRKVSDMYLVTTNVGKPELRQWKYPLPGDSVIAMIERVIIQVDQPKVIRLQIPADPHRATLSDDISSSGTFDDVEWSPDASKLAFVSTSRDHKEEKIRIADAETGAVREVFDEKVKTQYESGWGMINWHYLDKTQEFIWFSERDNWGHLYLYDAKTGKLKNQITKGDWLVSRLLRVDEKKRQLYFIALGRQKINPYFGQLCRIGFDGKGFTVLTPEEGNHMVAISPSGEYFTDSFSQPDKPGEILLRSADGKMQMPVARTDISRLKAAGWKAPIPVTVKAHDGKTDLYGLMYTPTQLDPAKKYPVIDYIYPGPQGGSVGNWFFSAARKDNQALAELGFVVVEIEGTSNPLRSKSFHDMSYGNMAENTLPDQVSGIRQLAAKHSYMDTARVGIWGHSGGGFATATAMFRFPEFFKVGISESGNHDNRNYEDDWGERYNGLAGNSDYEAQANQNYAKNLKGKLMLAHGMMDNNVPPYNTLLVVEALEKANKDYDLVIFPNSAHGFGAYSPYMMRRRWDYFVKNLLGAEPPKEFNLQLKPDPRTGVGN
ncbi:MAG: DPP IV N-terminal domain-containing protein [Mucilaginibacter polytrichastri]|nr:DPP IV N-terminal domain-containing protein [Mucilaginibacter polytrichastri]